MHFVVTAGPTIEPLDQVRRLTNFSTGHLGTELASYLAERGHRVTLLLSEHAVCRPPADQMEVIPFTTTASLRAALGEASRVKIDAVFHAAAVCDFTFGEMWVKDEKGELSPVDRGKISTRAGRLTAELVPTPKLISELRDLYPDAWLVGWKYEVDEDRASVLAAAADQIRECRTNACVANGPAYGEGFGVLAKGEPSFHARDQSALFSALLGMLTDQRADDA